MTCHCMTAAAPTVSCATLRSRPPPATNPSATDRRTARRRPGTWSSICNRTLRMDGERRNGLSKALQIERAHDAEAKLLADEQLHIPLLDLDDDRRCQPVRRAVNGIDRFLARAFSQAEGRS